MIPSSKIGLLKIKPNVNNDCIECKACNKICPMGVNAMNYMKQNSAITDSECILCNDCGVVCPTKKIG
jgi:ferredoxin